uniref:Uncharacterized protein n=1 Tax=mine drainage metagenome TaxID=410659 RepID=E6PV23_9ZZZZ
MKPNLLFAHARQDPTNVQEIQTMSQALTSAANWPSTPHHC